MEKVVATNKKAYHDFFVEDTIEAGIVLAGTEVKSIRLGRVNLKDSYAHIRNNEIFVVGMHISPYQKSGFGSLDSKRVRKLLLNKREILKLKSATEQKGYTLIPLRMYFKSALIKVEVGLCKGKQLHDKRATIKEKEERRNVERLKKEYNVKKI